MHESEYEPVKPEQWPKDAVITKNGGRIVFFSWNWQLRYLPRVAAAA